MRYIPISVVGWSLLGVGLCSLMDVCGRNKNLPRRPLVAALLDLHEGEACDTPNIAGFQQLAVVEDAVKQINHNSTIKLGLHVLDTCSSQQGAVTAAVQAFVASQQTCLHAPLFAGFIGPENLKHLIAVKNFTGSFNFTHMVAYSVLEYGSGTDRALFVASYPVREFAQTIETVLKKLEVKSPLIIWEEGPRGWALSKHLLVSNGPCNVRTTIGVQTSQDIRIALRHIEMYDGAIFMVESQSLLEAISRTLDSESIEDPVIIVDLKNSASRAQHTWNRNVLFISLMSETETRNNVSSMTTAVNNALQTFSKDSNRICAKHKIPSCDNALITRVSEEEYDWTLQLYRMSVLLLGSALGVLQQASCTDNNGCLEPDLPSQNLWHDYLKSATYRDGTTTRMSFGMKVPDVYELKVFFGAEGLRKIGVVEKGEILVTTFDYLPVRIRNVSCLDGRRHDFVGDWTTVPPVATVDAWSSWLNAENARLFEAVGLVCGTVVGVLVMMLILTRCVYTGFKPEQRPRSPSSRTTLSRAGSINS